MQEGQISNAMAHHPHGGADEDMSQDLPPSLSQGAASSSSTAPIILPPEVPRGGGTDIETALAPPGTIGRGEAAVPAADASSLEPCEEGSMTERKAASIAVAEVLVSRQYRHQQIELSSIECNQIARLAVEIGGSHVLEIFSPARFTAEAPRWGLRPGFAVDLSEKKPYGPNEGEYWDLSRDSDIKELHEMLDYERPYLLTGGPPCEAFSMLQALSKDKRPEEETARRLEVGLRHLHTAVRIYRRQYEEGRVFLHEHPAGATSWDDSEVIALQKLPGVFTVCGPMCTWGMEVSDGRRSGLVFKKTKWVTNSPRLAKVLDTWCSNQSGTGYHVHVDLIGGLARQAARYPPKLVAAILKELKEHLMEDGVLSAMEARASGPNPSQDNWVEWSEETWEDVARFFDNVSGEVLPTDKVLEARAEELRWCRDIGLYTKVLRQVSTNRGIRPVPTGWVDVNKGDKEKYNVRSRLVGKELKKKTKEALLAHELFSPMPPWEMVKVLLGFLVTEEFEGIHKDDLVMGCFDISRAHFMSPAERELYIELPEEDKSPEEGDIVGRLNRMMYGFRDASNGWARNWQALLRENGYDVGKANAALFYNKALKARGAVHGDDFYVLGPRAAVDEMGRVLKTKYKLRESYRLGFGPKDDRTASILNRVVTVSEDAGGRRQVVVEPDARHVKIILKSLGLNGNGVKSVAMPGTKKTDVQEERRLSEPPLGRAETTPIPQLPDAG